MGARPGLVKLRLVTTLECRCRRSLREGARHRAFKLKRLAYCRLRVKLSMQPLVRKVEPAAGGATAPKLMARRRAEVARMNFQRPVQSVTAATKV
jgi:hypothetical protein